MIKFSEISNFSGVKTFPNIKTHADVANYTVVVPDLINKVTAIPTAATAQGKDVAIIMQNFGTYVGDQFFDPLNVTGGLIPQDEYVLCVGLQSIASRFLDIDSQHITGTFSTIAAGTYLVAGTDGKFAIAGTTAPTDYGIYFLVTDILSSLAKPLVKSEGAVRVQIVMP